MRLCALGVLAACAAEGPCPDGLHEVKVHATGDPVVLATRDGAGAWQPLERDEGGEGSFCAANDYEVLWICQGTRFVVLRRASTIGELDHLEIADCTPAAERVSLVGRLEQAGLISVADETHLMFGADHWVFRVAPGHYDLVATNAVAGASEPPVATMRRGLSIQEATMLDPIDLVGDGLPMRPIEYEVRNVMPEEVTGASTTLKTSRDASLITSEGDAVSAYLMPLDLLEDGDREFLTVEASAPGRYRVVRREVARDARRQIFDLPDLPTDVRYDALDGGQVTWPYAQSSEYLELRAQLFMSGSSNQASFVASRGWMQLHATDALPFRVDHPAFDPTWFTLAKPYAWTFSAMLASPDTVLTGVNGVVTP